MTEHPSVPQRLVKLAEAALVQTRAGRMEWRATDDEDAFLFSGTKTSLVIDRYPQADYYEFRVLNARGTIVEELTRYRQKTDDPWVEPQVQQLGAEFDLLSQLHDAARRTALNIDELLDSALNDIQTDPEGLL